MRLPRYEYRAETFKMELSRRDFPDESFNRIQCNIQDKSFKMIFSRRKLQGETSKMTKMRLPRGEFQGERFKVKMGLSR